MYPIASSSTVIHSHKDKAPQLYAAAVSTYVLAMIAVALRFWARKLTKLYIGFDDWTITGALLVTTGYFVSVIVSLHQGFGQYYEVLRDGYAITFGKTLFADDLLYFLVIGLVKISILAFYWRLFGTKRSVRISCHVLGVVVICWEVTVILVTVFQCIPVSGFWDQKLPSKCISEKHFFIGNSIPNILTDIALLVLPAREIWQLQTGVSQKIALAVTFALGGFISVISIIRLVILLNLDLESPDLAYNYVSLSSWSVAESNMAIVAACLPSLRPILTLNKYYELKSSARGTSDENSRQNRQLKHDSAKDQLRGTSRSLCESQHNSICQTEEGRCGLSKTTVQAQDDQESGDLGSCDLEHIKVEWGYEVTSELV